MIPIVDGIEQQYGQHITVKRVNANVGDGPKIVQDYRLPGHPTTLIFDKEGQEVARFFGPQAAETVELALQKVLPKEP